MKKIDVQSNKRAVSQMYAVFIWNERSNFSQRPEISAGHFLVWGGSKVKLLLGLSVYLSVALTEAIWRAALAELAFEPSRLGAPLACPSRPASAGLIRKPTVCTTEQGYWRLYAPGALGAKAKAFSSSFFCTSRAWQFSKCSRLSSCAHCSSSRLWP